MTIQIKAGSTSRKVEVAVFDIATGLPYTTAAYNDAGISLWYRRGVVGAKTAITPATQTVTGAYSSGGFVAVGNGRYRLDLPDAALAAGVDEVEIGGGATAWHLIAPTVQLVGYDPRTELTSAFLAGTPQTGDSFARIGAAGAGLTAVGDTAGTTTLLSRITALLQTKAEADTAHGLLATAAALAALNNLSSAQAQTAAAAALTAYDPPTHAEMTAELATADDATLAAIAGLNNLSSAQAQAAAAAALTAYDGPTNTELTTALSAADDAVLAAIAALNNLDATQVEAAALAALVAYPVPLIADIDDSIAAGAGATPATFWNYTGPGGRTLTQSMIAILSSMIAGNKITITRGDTYSIPITGLGDLSGRDGLWFTVKMHPSHETDAQAKIQITEDDGLLRLNGGAADTPGDASITIDDEVNGDITLNLSAAMTAALVTSGTFPSRTTVKSWSWRWDVQVRQPGPGVWTPRAGAFVVEEDVTRAT